MTIMFATNRLVFRMLCSNDLEFMLKLTGNPEVVRYLPGMITDEGMMRSWLSSVQPEDNEYLICLKETGEPIGECSLTLQENDSSCEIGYMLLPQYWNQGYGTEVAEWLMSMARAYDVLRITAMTHAQNTASVSILEKLGFKKNSIGWMLFEASDGLHDSQIDCYVYEKETNILSSEESEHEDG